MSPPGGRRPAPTTRGVFAIEQAQLVLPDPIALDTSFVVDALAATQPLHAACSALLRRIDESGVTVVTSDLLVVELAEATFKNALKERWGRKWLTHRTDGRSRRSCTQQLNHTIARYNDLLSSIDHFPVPLGDVTGAARVLMSNYGLASYDAIHAATAIGAGAKAIVTLDTGFALLPATELAVYTDRSRLASCRKKRGR
jgi:predicted nucleic acid-binding protein